MTPLSKQITMEVILSAVAIGIITTVAVCWYQKKKLRVPTVWRRVGIVKNLYIYPFKSGKPIELETALCTAVGVKAPDASNLHQLKDRSFVVYNDKDKAFQTAQTISKLVLIKIAAVDQHHVTLTAPDMPILVIKVPNSIGNNIVTITQHHGEKIQVIDCGDDVSKWISKYVSEKENNLRIGYNDAKLRRNINISHKKFKKVYPKLSNESTGLQSNFSSYLLVNESSVKDLQNKIPEANITHFNFRPNILVEGAPAFAEDDWEWIKIGDVILYTIRCCTRCVITTVNPNTGIKSKLNEPLRMLRMYRQLKDVKNIDFDGTKPLMGLSMGFLSGTKINVGDVVYVGK